NNFSPRETTIKRFQIADTATWIRGAHSLKVGADVNHDDIFNFFPGFFGGSYTFNSLASFNRGIPNGSGESYQQNFGGTGTTGPAWASRGPRTRRPSSAPGTASSTAARRRSWSAPPTPTTAST